jgi:Zn-dependent metalloprotease
MKTNERRLPEQSGKQLNRMIYSANSDMSLPGKVARREGDPPTGDVAVDEAYDRLGIAYDFFWNVYGRNSIDNKGMPLKATVHYGRNYANAFWNGELMIIGDGDEDLPEQARLFNRFTVAADIIPKELAKGIIQAEAELPYWGQSGALNESISDVFGLLVKQYALNQSAERADWLVASGLFTPNVKGQSIRSIKAPGTAYDDPLLGKDPQVAHMRDYQHTDTDNGGVHINSGIPNHAFYLVAVTLGGYAWEKAGRIWYETLQDSHLKPKAQFRDFAQLSYATASRLYGNKSDEALAVKYGWEIVGIKTVKT